jgi:SAM-dependent methyltransferase
MISGAWDFRKSREWDLLAEWYDLLWPRKEDLSFYHQLAIVQGGPLLELGCGTGRVACGLAELGHHVIGLDISSGQLRQAERRKLAMDPTQSALVEYRQLSAAEFHFAERFPLIIGCFSTVFELGGPAARLATYKRCREHVTENGILALDNSFQGNGEQAVWGKNRPHGLLEFCNSFPHPENPEILVQHFEAQHYDADDRMKMTIFLDATSPVGLVTRRCFEVTRYYASPEQTEAELREAGFTRIELYGGFRRERFLDPSLQGRGRQVFIART